MRYLRETSLTVHKLSVVSFINKCEQKQKREISLQFCGGPVEVSIILGELIART